LVFFHGDDLLFSRKSRQSWKTMDMKSIQSGRS
jgi:hypothetical protein